MLNVKLISRCNNADNNLLLCNYEKGIHLISLQKNHYEIFNAMILKSIISINIYTFIKT